MSDMRALFADPNEICALCSSSCRAGLTPRPGAARIVPLPAGADPDGRLRALLDQQIAQTDQLYALLCSLNLPILYLCPDMRLSFFTEAAAQLFGLCPDDLGTRLDLHLPLAATSDVGGIGRTEVETIAICRNAAPVGRPVSEPQGRVWQCRALPHVARDGAPGGMMVILLAHPAIVPVEQTPALEEDLTPRQRQVMDLVLAGHPSKNIAADLKISQRTVENHRAAIMRRTGATSLPALARMALGVAAGADRTPRHAPRSLAEILA